MYTALGTKVPAMSWCSTRRSEFSKKNRKYSKMIWALPNDENTYVCTLTFLSSRIFFGRMGLPMPNLNG